MRFLRLRRDHIAKNSKVPTLIAVRVAQGMCETQGTILTVELSRQYRLVVEILWFFFSVFFSVAFAACAL